MNRIWQNRGHKRAHQNHLGELKKQKHNVCLRLVKISSKGNFKKTYIFLGNISNPTFWVIFLKVWSPD